MQLYKHLYNTMYNKIADSLQEMILTTPMQYQKVVVKAMQLNSCSFLKFSKSTSREILKDFDYFSYIDGRFPEDDNLVNEPKDQILDFISTNNETLPPQLFERFRGNKSALVCSQFLCAFNIQLGDLKLLKNNSFLLEKFQVPNILENEVVDVIIQDNKN